MDYRIFRGFEQIATQPLPRTFQNQELFLLELRFSAETETRSVPVTWQMERSRFGEVTRLALAHGSSYFRRDDLPELSAYLSSATPPVMVRQEADEDSLVFVFIEQSANDRRSVPGALVFNRQGQLATVVAHLR